MTKRSIYLDQHVHPGQERLHIKPSKAKYVFVYPFVKTRPWYLLPKEERQRVMDEHIAIGHKYPSVKINTTYSFGLDDQDFVVAFETNEPADFVDLVMDLRETESSLFTVRDTPIFTCVSKPLAEVLSDLG
jgi:chlorite dismutase